VGKVIGIDLGTTNSVMAIRVLKSDIIENSEGECLTPSVVSYSLDDEGEIIVGRKAQDLRALNPENTIRSIKRLMGRSFADREVQSLIESGTLDFTVVKPKMGTSSGVAIRLTDGKEFLPQDISGDILRKLKKDAESRLNDEVNEAVITVPAYFNEKQKHATYEAARLAGFKVSRLLSEPSAAAIAYGIDESPEPKTLLVYDFGGGTLDISILTYANGHFMEQAKGGDMWLGGDDIDRLIAGLILEKLAGEVMESPENLKAHIRSLSRSDQLRLSGEVARKAEEAKIALGQNKSSVIVEINSTVKGPQGGRLLADIEISHDEFVNLIAPLVAKSENLVEVILHAIHFTPDIIEHVLMVGGSSSILPFQDSLKRIFGTDKVKISAQPMLAIAEGAAIVAKKMAGQEDAMGNVMYRSAHDYYLQLANGERILLVEKQTPLPVTVNKELKYEHQTQLLGHFCFLNKVHGEFQSIGDLWLSHLPEEIGYDPDRKPYEIDMAFTITEDELVQVSVSLAENINIRVAKTISRGGEDEKLFASLRESIDRFNEEVKAVHDPVLGGFNFLYYSASLGSLISREANEKKLTSSRVDDLLHRISATAKHCLSDGRADEDNDDDRRGYHWNKYLHYQGILKGLSDTIEDREHRKEYGRLVRNAYSLLTDVKSENEVEKAFDECRVFLMKNSPQTLMMASGGPRERTIEPSQLSHIRTGLVENAMSGL
jgi:molecular chaperone DnaK